jgi:hypothetical protein
MQNNGLIQCRLCSVKHSTLFNLRYTVTTARKNQTFCNEFTHRCNKKFYLLVIIQTLNV